MLIELKGFSWWKFEFFGQINTNWIHKGSSGWDFESYGQLNIEQMMVMAPCKWSSNCLPGLKYIGSLQGSGTAQMQDSRLHKKYSLYTFVIGSQNSDTRQSVFKKIHFVTCTSSSPLCPGFLPQVSCLDILSEFPRKIRILRYFAVLAKSWAQKTKFGLLPKRVWINKESRKEDPSLTTRSLHFEIDSCSGCCDLSPIVIYWEGNLSLDHQVSYVQLKRYEG